MMIWRNRRAMSGQAMVEYLLIVTAIILGAVYGVTKLVAPKAKARQDQIGQLMDTTNTKIKDGFGLK